MCGITAYIGGGQMFEENSSFDHTLWAKQIFINENIQDIVMDEFSTFSNINPLRTYCQNSNKLRKLIKSKIKNKNEFAISVDISYQTLLRIINQEQYWSRLSTLYKIADKLNLSVSTIHKEIKEIKTKNSKSIQCKSFSLNPELARILGHIIGDGGIHMKKSEGKYRAFYVNNQPELLNSFESDVNFVFGKQIQYRRQREDHGDEIWLSSTLGTILYNLLEYTHDNKKVIPSIIKNSTKKNVLCAFLQALYDDDGYLYPDKKMIVISMKYRHLIEDIRNIVLKLEINCNPIRIHRSKSRTTMYYFSVTSKKNILKFGDLVNFKHKIKIKKMQKLIESYR